jgi:ABC-2 type transport system ATP-binding protein
VLSTRSLGNTKSAVVFDELDDGVRRRARSLHVDIGPIPLQDLFVALTESTRHPEDVPT